MCRFCELKPNEKAFSNEGIERGELLSDDCDIDAYLIKHVYKFNNETEYFINLESYNGYESGFEINYCPICGKKLN